jgi:ATP-dependent DNA helicase RecG
MKLADVSESRLKIFLKRAGLKWSMVSNALEKLGLLREGRLLNATSVFFPKTSNLQLRCAVFGGTSSATIIDRHDFEGNILELIEEAQKYILKNIHIGMRLKGLYREDIPEISAEAMRETIINAFCHRDYRDPDHVQIAIFKNRVEIRSPGELFDGLTIKKIRKGNISRRRNPLIADLLRRIQMVEAWGRGMSLILEKEPGVEFKESAKLFITSFARPSFNETEKTPIKSSLKTSGNIVLLMREKSDITIPEIAERLKKTTRAIDKQINKLKADKVIRRIGPDKGGYWEVLK